MSHQSFFASLPPHVLGYSLFRFVMVPTFMQSDPMLMEVMLLVAFIF